MENILSTCIRYDQQPGQIYLNWVKFNDYYVDPSGRGSMARVSPL